MFKINSTLNKIMNNALVVLSGNVGANIFGLLSVTIFTKSMGAEIFGYYVLFITIVEVVDKIFNFQTWQAFIKYATDFQVNGKSDKIMMLLKYCFLVDLFSLVVAAVIAYLSVDYFIDFFDIPIEYDYLLEIMAISLVFRVLGVSSGIFRLFDQFKLQSKILVISALFKFSLYIIISILSPSFESFVYGSLFSQFIAFIMTLYGCKKVLNDEKILINSIIKERIEYDMMKEMKVFSFILYNNFDVSVRMVSRQLDIFVLGRLYGSEVVGVYRIAKDIVSVIGKVTDPIYQAIYPELAKLLANGEVNAAKQVTFKISKYAGMAGLLLYVAFIFFGSMSISLFFGSDFTHAYNIVLVYFFAILISIVSLPLVPVLQSKGLAKEALMNQIKATACYLIVLYPLTNYLSSTGSAISYIIFYVVWLVLTLKTIQEKKVFI
ncbi:lipopolysaccharide biosynthesis protein [Vibrio splendidus]|uniref:lipopolysaccharide biosynthesis protein n=1 Tax=Vibrio splendidus TaxID=29497 RepID=UPI000D3A846B|nr:oligosaccharide flippase family protein [Vibrio splendidus]PTP66502.1 hypothetical protein CWO31_11850 [Vibrio splendidus]